MLPYWAVRTTVGAAVAVAGDMTRLGVALEFGLGALGLAEGGGAYAEGFAVEGLVPGGPLELGGSRGSYARGLLTSDLTVSVLMVDAMEDVRGRSEFS